MELAVELTQVDPEGRQIQLVAWDDEWHPLLDQSFPLVGGDPIADINDIAREFGEKVFGVLANRRRRDFVVASIHDSQALTAQDLHQVELVGLLEEDRQAVTFGPRAHRHPNAERLIQVVRDLGRLSDHCFGNSLFAL